LKTYLVTANDKVGIYCGYKKLIGKVK